MGLSTKEACIVARVDRFQLNEQIKAGYPAPETEPGTPRSFEEDDLIALYIFGRSVDAGSPPRSAANLANMILTELKARRLPLNKNMPELKELAFVTEISGRKGLIYDLDQHDPEEIKAAYANWWDFRIINVKLIREELKKQIHQNKE